MEVSGIRTHIVCPGLFAASLHFYIQILVPADATAAAVARVQYSHVTHTVGSIYVDGCDAVAV